MCSDMWWYEPQYRSPVTPTNFDNNYPVADRFMGQVKMKLGGLKYRDEIVQQIVRYTRSLDSADWNYSFLQLWSILEKLTGVSKDENHKVAVKRAVFLFKDREYYLQCLNHLRECRNEAVHAGEHPNNMEPLLYQLKHVVEVLIEFHLGQAGNFASIAEAAEFMDSPVDKKVVRDKIRKLGLVEKYLR